MIGPQQHPLRLVVLLSVALGGAVGACLRWQLGDWFPATQEAFPWTTFGINVSGSVLLALLPAVAAVRRHPIVAAALGAGVLGGFTTLSAYSEETRALLAAGHTGTAAIYLVGTLAACLLGVAVAERLGSRAGRDELRVEEGEL